MVELMQGPGGGTGTGGGGGTGGDHGDDEHCMECASEAAVGAAAAAAATARGGGQSGGEGIGLGADDAGAYTNPYACMLTPEKIQALEAHKNSAVAKRWAREESLESCV